MTIQKDIAGYWDTRAEGYSLRTIDEIKSPKGEAWVKRIKELLTLPAGSAVADMGCGAGFLALAAARAGLTATGFDASEGMLEEARANAEALRLTVRFQKADITQTHCPDRSFDAVLSRNAVWNLPAPEAALREWFRILKPGGKLLYADGNHYRYLDDPLWLAAKEKPITPTGTQSSSYSAWILRPWKRLQKHCRLPVFRARAGIRKRCLRPGLAA